MKLQTYKRIEEWFSAVGRLREQPDTFLCLFWLSRG